MTAEPRDVEAIRVDLAAWRGKPPGEGAETRRRFLDIVSSRLAADVEPLLARLAAADRENAELRGEVERLTEWRGSQCDVLSQRVDEARAQLAAAQAQLAEALSVLHEFVNVRGDFYEPRPLAAMIERLAPSLGFALRSDWRTFVSREREAATAEARLEAVRALVDEAFATRQCHVRDECEMHTMVPAAKLRAALSAEPQPEPCEHQAFVEQVIGLPEGLRAEILDPGDEPARPFARGYAPAGVPSCRCVLLVGPIWQHQCQHEGDATMDGGPDFGKRCGTRIDERVCALAQRHDGDHEWCPPASDEPARKMTTASEIREQDAWIRGERDEPARTPDLMAALRVSVEAAKKRRIAPKDES